MSRPRKTKRTGPSDDRTLIIENCKIWTSNRIQEGSILIENGRISRIARTVPKVSDNRIDAKGLLALPGLIDVHVHLRDLQLSYKEDFTSGTKAAAAGGFTTVLDMPNTKPVTDSPNRLKEKIRIAEKKIVVNVGFHVAAVTNSSNISHMANMGAFCLKLYLPHPISPLADNEETILQLFKGAARNRIPVTVHAEDPGMMRDAGAGSYLGLAKNRPPAAESQAVRRILRIQKRAGCFVHFAHLTLPSSIDQINSTGSRRISSEVTPHHILLSEQDLARSSWKAWMVPPLRSPGLRRRLLNMASLGKTTLIASDHAPHSLKEKQGPPSGSPPGIPGLETTLPLLLTLVNKGVLSISRVVDLLCKNPAFVFGLSRRGRLAKGNAGDVVIVDLKKRGRIRPENFFSKAKYSPFEGFETRGQVQTTIVGGRIVHDQGEIVSRPGTGEVLRRVR